MKRGSLYGMRLAQETPRLIGTSESPAALFPRQPSLVSVKTDDRTRDAFTGAAQAPLLAVKQENQ